MSQSPSQNTSSAAESSPAPPVRRLQSPAERFRAGEIARDEESLEVSPFDNPANENGRTAGGRTDVGRADAELEPQPQDADPFQPLPRAENAPARNEMRGAQTRRARRTLQPHAPHHHEKKQRAVGHKPINAAPEHEPQNDWDRAAQNSMARAALARRKNRMRRVIGKMLIATSVLVAVWAVGTALTAPQFEVKNVEVSGLQATPRAQVEKIVGDLIGKNVFRAPRAQVESALEALPTVKTVRVQRAWSWPPHMNARIVERQPILQVGAGTTWWVADAQGVAFRRADRRDSDLQMLTSEQFHPIIGKPLPAAPWKRARELAGALNADNAAIARENGGSKQSKFWDLRRVYLDKNGAAALRVSAQGALKQHGEMLIRLGEEGWPAKLKQARVALAYFERTGRKASELDLVSGDHPRWRPKTEGETEKTAEAENTNQDLNVESQD